MEGAMIIEDFVKTGRSAAQELVCLPRLSGATRSRAGFANCRNGLLSRFMKAVGVASVLVLSAAPSIHAQTIYQKEDRFDGSVIFNTELRDADLEGGSFFTSRYVLLNFVAQKPVPSPDRPYALLVRTRTPEWVFIESGPSLLLKLNGGEMLQLDGSGSSRARHVEIGGTVTETAIYNLTPSELQRISRAQSVDFRIVGDRQFITGKFGRDLVADAGALFSQGPQLLGLTDSVAPQGAPQVQTSLTAPSGPQSGPTDRRVTSNSAPTLGINMVPTPDVMVPLLKMDGKHGLWILKIVPDSAAARAGLDVGDVILSGNGKLWDTADDLAATMNSLHAGDNLTLDIWHASATKAVLVKF
jgi:hypothetical protein